LSRRKIISMNIAIVIAGGKGVRTGQPVPKQFLTVKEKPILIYTLEKFERCPVIHEIYVVVDQKYAAITEDYIKLFAITKLREIVSAGSTRNQSICNALEKIRPIHGKEEIIVIHHANMPFVTEEEIQEAVNKTGENNIVFMAAQQWDYMVKVEADGSTGFIEREGVGSLRAPETMSLGNAVELYGNYLREEESKPPLWLFAQNNKLAEKLTFDIIKCSAFNFKITTLEDFRMARAIILDDGNR